MILILRFYVHKVTVSLGPNFPSRAGREPGTQRAPAPPKPLTQPACPHPLTVLPQIRFLLSSGNRCPGRGQSRVTARAAVCEVEETGHPGLTAAQREGPALVTSAHLPGKTHPCTSPFHLLPRERAPAAIRGVAATLLPKHERRQKDERRDGSEGGLTLFLYQIVRCLTQALLSSR